MDDSWLFSDGVDRVLDAIRPYRGDGLATFPKDLSKSEARRSPSEPLQAWFKRLVDKYCKGDPRRVAIEDNIAVFVQLKWQNKDRLVYANVQTLIATVDLEKYYLGESDKADYLRLDSDCETLGTPFSHPLAHIHIEADLPRFGLDGGISGNIIVDYLEFLYRQYYPKKWEAWARRVWSSEFSPASDTEVDPFEVMVQAFSSNQIETLRKNKLDLGRIKKVLRRHKDEAFGLHVDGGDRELLEYPSAR